MIKPIVVAKQKIEDHKVLIASTAGLVAGTAITAIIMKKPPTMPPNLTVNVPQTIDEIKAVLDRVPNGIFEVACDTTIVTIITEDAVKELF